MYTVLGLVLAYVISPAILVASAGLIAGVVVICVVVVLVRIVIVLVVVLRRRKSGSPLPRPLKKRCVGMSL